MSERPTGDARRRRTGRTLLVAAALVAALAVAVPLLLTRTGQHRTPDGEPAARVAEVWTTTADGVRRVERTATVDPAPAGTPDPGTPTITVDDPAGPAPEVTGFGAALTLSSASLLLAMPEDDRRALLTELFDPAGPVRLSVVRVALGGSDFVPGPGPATTYDDLPPGETDGDLERFSSAGDEPLRALLREIRVLAPDLTVIASPWSPPAWLKTSGSLEGGRLLDDDRAYATYATYLVRSLQEWAAAGVPVDALTVQNEPQARHPDGYPGTDLPVADEVRLLDALGPALADAGLDPAVLAYDHNWALHPADAASTPEGADPEADYPLRVLRSDAARWVAGVAFHCYSGDASAQDAVRDEFPDAAVWVTECSGSHAPGTPPEQVFADTLGWQSRHLLVASLAHGASAVLTWNLALDPDGGPHVGGCGTCTGVVTVDGAEATPNAEHDVLAHAARFLPRGSTRVGSTSTAGDTVAQVALRTPAGATVLLVAHDGDEDATVDVLDGGARYPVRLPPRSLSTVLVGDAGARAVADPGTARAADPDASALPTQPDLSGAVATADPAGPDDPCCTGDVAARAIDDDPATRWSTGRPQRPGDALEVDLGRAVAVRGVVLDAGAGSAGDWPRGYEVLASADGASWTVAAPARAGAGQVAAAALDGTGVRYLRVRLTADADPWWSVAELRVLA
ncbi:discoidin domain-containing protein [Cellulomonas sp. PS-H5]|uniref:discoidin domain-containing protein n=1 Tax=Cellulomonas sp. PS-H5 TaxID=2820400 RepID=UPI001C4E9618|nr:discoidin domain-containing protein [Cellulomonas sp. PS-H5]MBW0253038.1 discoidin domain-containing protein [Cellulomonas sp. PS-H5]